MKERKLVQLTIEEYFRQCEESWRASGHFKKETQRKATIRWAYTWLEIVTHQYRVNMGIAVKNGQDPIILRMRDKQETLHKEVRRSSKADPIKIAKRLFQEYKDETPKPKVSRKR